MHHLGVVKRVLHYINGTTNYGVHITSVKISCYSGIQTAIGVDLKMIRKAPLDGYFPWALVLSLGVRRSKQS